MMEMEVRVNYTCRQIDGSSSVCDLFVNCTKQVSSKIGVPKGDASTLPHIGARIAVCNVH